MRVTRVSLYFNIVLRDGPNWQPSRLLLTEGGTDQCEQNGEIPYRVEIPGRTSVKCQLFPLWTNMLSFDDNKGDSPL